MYTCVVLESTEWGLIPIKKFAIWSEAEEFVNKHYPNGGAFVEMM